MHVLSRRRCTECEELCRRRIFYESQIHGYSKDKEKEEYTKCVRFCLAVCREFSTNVWKQ